MDYISSIQEKYEEIHNIAKPWESLHNEREYFESIIDTFFSKEGEQKTLQDIYEKVIKESVIKENKSTNMIRQENFENEAKIYNEYFEGMTNFVRDVYGTSEVTESVVEDFSTKIKRAMEKDHSFIECLEDSDEFNPKKNVSAMEATYLLNSMLDFKKDMLLKEEVCNTFMKKDNLDQKLKTESMALMCESVSYYWYHSICNMLKEYENLRESVMEDNDETPYVLF